MRLIADLMLATVGIRLIRYKTWKDPINHNNTSLLDSTGFPKSALSYWNKHKMGEKGITA